MVVTLNPGLEPVRIVPAVERSRLFPEIKAQGQRQRIARIEALLQSKEALQHEVHHRVGNSLQIIASILALDARNVKSREARLHLENAHHRILAVATVQHQLQSSGEEGHLDVAVYLRQLCDKLTASVVDERRVAIEVQADPATVSSAVATNMGLIVAELVINALKHAFLPSSTTGHILVAYRSEQHGWTLTVSDNVSA